MITKGVPFSVGNTSGTPFLGLAFGESGCQNLYTVRLSYALHTHKCFAFSN